VELTTAAKLLAPLVVVGDLVVSLLFRGGSADHAPVIVRFVNPPLSIAVSTVVTRDGQPCVPA
jgi:hypothetical protein